MTNGKSRSISTCTLRVVILVLISGSLASVQPQIPAGTQGGTSTAASETGMFDQERTGSISGTVEDQSGAVSVGAHVRLAIEGQAGGQEVLSGRNGEFAFEQVRPGRFQLEISSLGFITQKVSGVLHPGEFYLTPLVKLSVSGESTEVSVALSPFEIAEEQIKEQEKQRVFGIIPNFYVSYDPDPVPLRSKQKFKLAWRSSIDPVTIAGAGVVAGLQQASDDFSGYGQGMSGYAKRFGASYANIFAGTFIGSAIFPSLLRQDPRYFYKGTGSIPSRIGYALANSVVCKGDNKRWQVNYSSIAGSFATGAVSYLYYPERDRGAGLLLQSSLLRLAESSFVGVFQEFVVRKFTPHLAPRNNDPP
jgi:hypothetical protein